MKKICLIAVFAVLVLLILAAACTSAPSSEKVAIFSGHPDWAPAMSLDKEGKGEIVGDGPNATKDAFKTFGVRVESKYKGSWDIVLDLAAKGKIDGVVAAYKTKEREKVFLFSVPYMSDNITLFFLEDKGFAYNQKEDLVGKRGVATIGDSYGEELDEYIVQANADIVRVATPNQAFSMLREGKVDYFIYSASAGRKVIKEYNLSGFKESGTVATQAFHIAVSKKSPYAADMDKINDALRGMIAKGTVSG